MPNRSAPRASRKPTSSASDTAPAAVVTLDTVAAVTGEAPAPVNLRTSAHDTHNAAGHVATALPGTVLSYRTAGNVVAIRAHLHASQSIAGLATTRAESLRRIFDSHGHSAFPVRALQQKHLSIFLASGIISHVAGTGTRAPDPKYPGKHYLTDDKATLSALQFILTDAALYALGRPIGTDVAPYHAGA